METAILNSPEINQEAVKLQIEKENKVPGFNLSDNPNEVENQLKGFTKEPILDPLENGENTEEIKGKRGRKKKADTNGFTGTIGNSSVVTGALFLLLIDFVIPNVICMVNNKMSRKKINPALLKLTEEQRKELEPLADEVARQINLKGDPKMIFIASLAAIYIGNFMLIKAS